VKKSHRDTFLLTVALVFLVTLVASGYLYRITDGIKKIDTIKGILPLISTMTLKLNISTDVVLNILVFVGVLIVIGAILRIFGVKSAHSSENYWSGQHRYHSPHYYSPPPRPL
jgi:hypothetical protein